MRSPLGSTRCQNQVTNPNDGSVIISESKNAVRVKNRICESVDGKGWLDDIHGLTVISNIMPQRKIRTVDGCRWSCHASFFVLACSQPKVDRIRDQAGWLRSCQTLYLHAGIQRMQHHGTCSSVTWVPTVTRPNCRAKKRYIAVQTKPLMLLGYAHLLLYAWARVELQGCRLMND